MKALQRDALFKIAASAEVVLSDWDGCLALDNRLMPGAAELGRVARRLVIISNNSSLPVAEFHARVADQGLPVPIEHIHLAGQALLEAAAQGLSGRPVFLIGSPAMLDLAERLGLRLADRHAEAVLLLRDPHFDYSKLTTAVRLILAGAEFWTSNPDKTHPGAGGVTPETGALAASIQAASGRRPDLVLGKPHPHLFRRALASAQVSSSNVVMIGDNRKTDIAGARGVGIRGLLVTPQTWAVEASPATQRA